MTLNRIREFRLAMGYPSGTMSKGTLGLTKSQPKAIFMNIFYLAMEVDNRGLALLPLFKALFSVSTLIEYWCVVCANPSYIKGSNPLLATGSREIK